jgi:hypothetical protein
MKALRAELKQLKACSQARPTLDDSLRIMDKDSFAESQWNNVCRITVYLFVAS